MTWIDFMKTYDSSITEEIADYILWEQTAFPCSDIKITSHQIRSAIRAMKNKISQCELCGYKKPFHSHGCMAKEEKIA